MNSILKRYVYCIFFLSTFLTQNSYAEFDLKNSISNLPVSIKRFFSISEENQSKDFTFAGYASPTVYYIPVISESDNKCESDQKIQLCTNTTTKEQIKANIAKALRRWKHLMLGTTYIKNM